MRTVTTDQPIGLTDLKQMSEKMYGNLVKAVVDIEKQVMLVDAELHADQEQQLLDDGAEQRNLWGINFHPAKFGTNGFIEFDSMINLRPSQKNMSRSVDDPVLQQKIRDLVSQMVSE